MSALAASVVFRADASWTIGNGHVMRCLTLADALAQAGWETRFVCRAHDGHLGAQIEARGHRLTLLPTAALVAGDTAHAAWLGGTWQQDAEATRAALAGQGADWLVVDHYALDARWEDALRPVAARIMAIDDLADRPHACDILFDQNLGRTEGDYDGLIPAGARRLIGPGHALLRPEFAEARAGALARRAETGWQARSILIAMGGTDPDNSTGAILQALAQHAMLETREVKVVLGSNAPHLGAVRALVADLAAGSGARVELLTDRKDMAALMAAADLAIGGVGGTSWERCCLGLPTLLLVLADNQRPGAEALDQTGAAVLCGDARDDAWKAHLVQALRAACDPRRLEAMSRAAAAVCDGRGVGRVTAQMGMRLRAATMADAQDVWTWRRGIDPAFLAAGQTPELPAHLAWFQQALQDPRRELLMVDVGAQPAGHLRLDWGDQGEATVSIVLNPAFRGLSLAAPILGDLARHASARRDGHRLVALVHRDNTASTRAFRRAGFALASTEPSFSRWELDLTPYRQAGTVH